MTKIPVFYRPEQSCEYANSFSPSAGKPALVMADWLASPEIAPSMTVEHFSPVGDDLLELAHDERYVRHIMSCTHQNGFGNKSPQIAESLRYTVGSMVSACKHVLGGGQDSNRQVAVSLSSGFHHAGHKFGGGFCTFNGLMVAAIWMRRLGLAKRILILDLDAHRGNGTEDIIRTLGIDYVDHVTAGLSYKTAAGALKASMTVKRLEAQHYDLVIYQAGADMHSLDPLQSGLLSTSRMAERDLNVFASCIKRGTPVVWNLAGGYQTSPQGDIEPVLDLHRQTMIQCCRVFAPDTTGGADE